MNYTIRTMKKQEFPLLEDFLYEAIFIPEGMEVPPRSVISLPELQTYIKDFGLLKDDFALVAEIEKQIVGAVWVRIINDYGHIDSSTPSLAISLYKDYRKHGIGIAMMKEMLNLLRNHGYKSVSLSVQKANYAAQMYQKLGFKIVNENKDEWIIICHL
ncbi:GNAT family N-acetyltransferase [Mediterraneibacter gnavus]|uniref:GNAT family N-acetyltransferase n=1 Tax=Mediterraneibacter gnavus TaxID=33038 RepID=UPI0015705DAA|nr:GNAT family N-acetyltransferase [Mediterraneibacter gnavus]NSC47429.1 GNAT family N-acetyltransferase [Mediterraneibacter gnavus]